MSESKILGREAGNDIVIPKNDISSKHAKITRLDNDEFEIEDLDSLNGTFVNGQRILKATISLHDELRLSQDSIIDLAGIFSLKNIPAKQVKSDATDFVEEFARLNLVYNNYQKTRIKIQKNSQLKTSIIRSAFTLAPLVIFKIVINYIPPEEQQNFMQNYLIFSVLGSTVGVAATGNMSPIEKLSELDEDFKVKYVCPNPKCRRPLGMIPWTSYYNQGACGFCKAKYSK